MLLLPRSACAGFELNRTATMLHRWTASGQSVLSSIKHFTDLDVPDEIEEAMALLTALIDLEVLGTIIGALPQDQVVKVFELLTKTIDNIKNNVEEAEAEALALSAEADAEIEATEKEDEVDGDKSE